MLENGWVHEATELLRLSYDHIVQQGSVPRPQNQSHHVIDRTTGDVPSSGLASEFPVSLGGTLHDAAAPFIAPAQQLVAHILRTYISHDPPELLRSRKGGGHSSRGPASLDA